MFEWVGSLKVREHNAARVVLGLSTSTRLVGLVALTIGLYLTFVAWAESPWLAALPSVLAGFGGVLASLSRRLVIDREAGVLRVEQRFLGLTSRMVVPLFHLRAVVVMARPEAHELNLRAILPQPSRYVAYLDRRVGEAIYLDEARRCKTLLEMAEVIAEVAELRLEYDASAS